MSFSVDPNHPWRVASLSVFPVTYGCVGPCVGAGDVRELEEISDSNSGVEDWIRYEEDYYVDSDISSECMNKNTLHAYFEMADVNQSGGLAGSIQSTIELGYDYIEKETNCHLRSDGRHMPVRPSINQAALEAMEQAKSIDSVAKEVGLKLPRITAQGQSGGQRGLNVSYNQLETLRYWIARSARQDDYALRLFNAARVVHHTIVLSKTRLVPGPTSMMGGGVYESILTAELPLVDPVRLGRDSWWYIGDDLSEEYRAYLAMAGRGLQHFVDRDSQTIYSQCVSEPEVQSCVQVFVRKNGDLSQPEPARAAFIRVLSSPTVALSAYYAYAASLGIGHQATQVLVQAAIGPFIWGREAILPYRNAAPKLDAAAYLLRPTETNAMLHIGDIDGLVSSAAVIGMRTLVGLGATITAYKSHKKVALADVMAQVVDVLSSSEQSRALLRSIHRCMNPGYMALEWIDPFRTDTSESWDRCVEAYRSYVQLLAQYHRTPIRSLLPLFTTGVVMSGIGPGTEAFSTQYAETVVYQIADGQPISCESEKIRNDFVTDMSKLGMYMRWQAVVHYLRYGRGGSQGANPGPAPAAPVSPEVKPSRPGPPPRFVHHVPTSSSGDVGVGTRPGQHSRISSTGSAVRSPSPAGSERSIRSTRTGSTVKVRPKPTEGGNGSSNGSPKSTSSGSKMSTSDVRI